MTSIHSRATTAGSNRQGEDALSSDDEVYAHMQEEIAYERPVSTYSGNVME